MLQRIQSIWLFLAALCAFASLKLPIYTGTDTALQNIRVEGTITVPIMMATIAIGVIALINIFLYSNRMLQFRLCLLGILLEAGLLFMYIKYINQMADGTYALTSILQAGVLFFLFAAVKGVRKDEKLIKESNRLR